tara:strand:- start:611 stop:1303 length:693 start_codon:yes stop_codon:yes gene_type:complete
MMSGKTGRKLGAYRFVVLLAATGVIAGCSGVQKQLGLSRTAPDEFNVVSRAPLSLPPDINLRPPQPGTTRPQEGTMTDAAAGALFRGEQTASISDQPLETETRQFPPRDGRGLTDANVSGVIATASPRGTVERTSRGELGLLENAGASQAEPNIRQIVNAESTELVSASESFADNIIFWRKKDEPGTVVDADAERRRLQENEAFGRPATTGETPQIERKSRALLEGLFDF